MLIPRRRGLASINAEVRDGIVPAAERVARAPAAQAGEGRAGSRHYRTIALIVGAAMFMEQLDGTVLATALPSMARELGVSAPSLSIALTSYLISLAIFIPVSGRIADRFGARTVFRTAIVIFLPGSIACANAPNVAFLVVARFFAGHRRRADDAGGAAGADAQCGKARPDPGHQLGADPRRGRARSWARRWAASSSPI